MSNEGGRAVWGIILSMLLPLHLLQGCRPSAEKITLLIGTQELSVEVARTAQQRERGLMGRTGLGSRDAMIFLFDRDQRLAFWMKDTPTALSIAFLSSGGMILQIEDMEPFSERIVTSRLSARYALEMRKGGFADLGIQEGDTVRFPPGFPGSGVEP